MEARIILLSSALCFLHILRDLLKTQIHHSNEVVILSFDSLIDPTKQSETTDRKTIEIFWII